MTSGLNCSLSSWSIRTELGFWGETRTEEVRARRDGVIIIVIVCSQPRKDTSTRVVGHRKAIIPGEPARRLTSNSQNHTWPDRRFVRSEEGAVARGVMTSTADGSRLWLTLTLAALAHHLLHTNFDFETKGKGGSRR